MKKKILLPQLTAALLFAILFNGCSKDGATKKTYTYTIYSNPVYKSKAEVLAAINGNAATAVEHAGKLYIKDNFIFLNDINKGIHVYDNSNPVQPKQVAFLSIPGNLDIAVKGNILYADMYNDLLALDISDLHHAVITKTIKNFFINRSYFDIYVTNDDDKVAVDWTVKDTTVTINNNGGIIVPGNNCDFCDIQTASSYKSSSKGVAGSMASMVIVKNYLYAISEMHSLGIIDLRNPALPKPDSSFYAGFDLETVYPFEDKLFLGSSIGVFMYDISNPESPVAAGEFEHGTACDPVIADENYAYVTLHSGSDCGETANELDVVNIQNLQNSMLLKTYSLTRPTGLSKDGDLLFVCDNSEVKMYNADNPAALRLMKTIKSNQPYDVIAAHNKLMVVTKDGLYQYDYSNIYNIRQLSFISAKRD